MNKKKQATLSGIEQMDAQQRKLQAEKKREELNDRKERARPPLLKRVGIGLIDLLIAGIMAFGFFMLSYVTIFPSVGYQSSAQYIIDSYEKSHLFVSGTTGGYDKISKHYDEHKTPEENYDVPISYYYKNTTRAISDNKYEEYTTKKLNTGYYELNAENICVRKEGVSNATVKPILEQEYENAVSYFYKNPDLIKADKTLSMTMSLTLLIVATLSSTIFYILVPLADKKNRTFGYMIFKIMPVDNKTLKPLNKKKAALRNFVFIVISFISPFTLSFLVGNFAFSFIPFFINSAILSFSTNNTGLHDMAAGANVINESYSTAFDTLDVIKSQGGDQ